VNVSAALVRALHDAVGAEGLRDQADDLAFYGADRCRGDWPVAPALIVLPGSVEEAAAVVRACAEHDAKIVPSGGRTGLAGAATATRGEIVVSLERMNRILEVDPSARILRCQAGASVEAVQDAAADAGLAYPVDFAAKGSAQIGGSIATNAGGVKVLRYGTTRRWVAGLRVVVASGDVVDLGGALVKDNTGYDLRQLFIGSEGTLGLIVEATMHLSSPPRGQVVALCAVPDERRVLDLFTRVQSSLVLQAFECFDKGCLEHVLEHRGARGRGPFAEPSSQHALVEVEVEGQAQGARDETLERLTECLADAQDAGEISDAVLASTSAQERDLWALREGVSESLHGHCPHKADIALPVARVADFVVKWRSLVDEHLPEIEAVVFGHIGDGNLHLNILKPDAMLLADFHARCHAFDEHTYGLVQSMGGSISAEHGVGLLKRDHLHYSRSQTEIAMMRAVKQALDPRGLFNPDKIFAAGG
jgi:FAD/FMN-containing dehydrogenase